MTFYFSPAPVMVRDKRRFAIKDDSFQVYRMKDGTWTPDIKKAEKFDNELYARWEIERLITHYKILLEN